MKEYVFKKQNNYLWIKMEGYNKKLSNKSLTTLPKNELREYASLYRRVGLNLAYAKTRFPDSDVTRYLNRLMGAAHNKFYTTERNYGASVKLYFAKTFPEGVRTIRSYFFAASALFLAGMFFVMILSFINESYVYFFIPRDQVSFGDANGFIDYPIISSFVMTNNIRVAAMAYVWGFPGAIGTIYILLSNGALIGALTGLVIITGADALKYLSLILPHGFIELTAIFISGAGGLVLGKSILIPKNLTRAHSLVKSAKETAALIPGVAAMLVIAGIIEGFFTPLPINEWVKLAFSFVTLAALTLYFLEAGKNRPDSKTQLPKH